MDATQLGVEMRRFNSIQEIESEQRFCAKIPIHAGIYKRLVGYYKFPDGVEVECCVQKPNGNLCNTKHQKGWVAEITDGTLTLIGGDCATDKFDADSIVVRDINHANSQIDRQDRLARLAQLLAHRDSALHDLAVAKSSLIDLRKKVAAHRDRIGRVAWHVLTNMGRTGNTMIRVLGVTPEIRDKEGEIIRDRQSILINIASFSGVAVCDETKVTASLEGLRRIEAAYRRAGDGSHVELKPKEVKALNAALADQSREVARAHELMSQLERFEANDFASLAFAVADIGERTRLVQYGWERQGKVCSKSSAKKLVLEQEAALKLQYNVKQIRVQ